MCHDNQSPFATKKVDEQLEESVDREGLKNRGQHHGAIEQSFWYTS